MPDTSAPEERPESEGPIERAVERVEHAQAELAEIRREEAAVERELETAVEDLAEAEHRSYPLIINRKDYTWPHEMITGQEIKELAGSPSDWIVNERIDGPGEDPEIGNNQKVNLSRRDPPYGVKRFITRKPKTSPGA